MTNQTLQFTPRRHQNWKRNQNSTRYQSTTRLGPVAHTILVALMVTILGLIYLTQATKATAYDYEINKIDTKIDQLSVSKAELEVENARLASLDSVENSTVARQMTKPDKTTYIE